jgi:glycosyltransferase involved in cell wall biosynthesis
VWRRAFARRREAKHLCYIHAPMRYVWDQFDNYAGGGRSGVVARLGMELFRKRLQAWDVASAARVDQFVANSRNIAGKVQRYYDRPAAVLHPPVDWQTFQAAEQSEDFYLMVTAFAPYKRVDLAIQACNVMKRRLKIIGKGQEEARLRKLAGPTVEFLGWQPDEVVQGSLCALSGVALSRRGRFWYRPIGSDGLRQACACLRARGSAGDRGAVDGCRIRRGHTCARGTGSVTGAGNVATGVFFFTQSVESVVEAMESFERRRTEFDPHAIRDHVAAFDRRLFKERMKAFAMGALTGTAS